MSHTCLTFCRWRGRTAGVGFGQDGRDRVDPSPRDHQIKHVCKIYFKRWRSKGLPDATWRHEERLSSSTWRPRDCDLAATVKPDSILFMETHGASDFHRTAGKFRGRNPRSWCDRAAIVAPSARNQGHDLPTDGVRSDGGSLRINITIDARSWPNRGVIVVPLKRNWD